MASPIIGTPAQIAKTAENQVEAVEIALGIAISPASERPNGFPAKAVLRKPVLSSE